MQQSANVSVQLVNSDARVSIRVSLDRKVIYEGTPTQSSQDRAEVPPIVLGTFPLKASARHILVAEAVGTGVKSQFEWTPQSNGAAWAVISYYAGRMPPPEPAFFGIALQKSAYKLK